MNDQFPNLKIERMDDEIGEGLILLEQDDGCGNVDRIALHPIHLRYLAEIMGLIERSDPTALRTIATLQRRMLVLRDRIDHLDDWLAHYSDSRHADLSYEQTYACATSDIAAEFCADLVGTPPQPCVPQCATTAATDPAKATSTIQAKADALVAQEAVTREVTSDGTARANHPELFRPDGE